MRQIRLPEPLPVQFALRGLASGLDWGPVGRDLLGVAVSMLLADRLVVGGARDLQLSIPVVSPRLWREAAPLIEKAMSILTGDRFAVRFTRTKRSLLPFPRPEKRAWNSAPINQVALFSGGLDSAVAAAQFARQGLETAYVTHYSKGIGDIQRLLQDIDLAYGGSGHPQLAQFYLRPVGPMVGAMRERSRRARSFFFVSLALATAASVNAAQVRVCENGVLALNIPLQTGMVPTRHAHSEFLLVMEKLGQLLFEKPIRVVNPFELETKGQMTKVFQSHPDLALRTVSCWNQQWSGRGRSYSKGHCGLCLPCLVRLVSLKAAGLPIPRRHFDRDARLLLARKRNSRAVNEELGMVRLLMDFTSRVERCRNWREFVASFPAASLATATSGPSPWEEWVQKVYRMFKRFAREVGRALPVVQA